MKRVAVALAVVLLVPTGEAQAASKFKNCTELRKAYPNGVALTAAAASRSGAKFSPAVYNANKGMDRDRDKVACEK